MRQHFYTRLLYLIAGWAAGFASAIIWKGSEKVAEADMATASPTPPLLVSTAGANQSAPEIAKVAGATNNAASSDGIPNGETPNSMRLEIPTATLKSLSRYLRFTPFDSENAFQPSRELIELFGLTETQVYGIKRSIQSSFEDLAKAESANATLCTDEQKGDYFKLRQIDSADQLRANFSNSLIQILGEAKGLAVASILANSVLFSDFGSYPRIMYLDERKSDDGSSYFMLTQQRIADDLDVNTRNFGSSSMFMTKKDIEKRFGAIHRNIAPKKEQNN